MKLWKTKLGILGIIGLFFIVAGAILFLSWAHIFDAFYNLFDTTQIITPESKVCERWKYPNSTISNVDIYFFNWTNPHELNVQGKKPNLVEVGPYSFVEKIEKKNRIYHPENNTISFDQFKFWDFDVKRSAGNLSDEIVQLNTVAISAAHKIRYWPRDKQNNLSFIFKSFHLTNISIVRTINDILFVDYKDIWITIMSNELFNNDTNISLFDYFGQFKMANKSNYHDGHFSIGAGMSNLSNLGKIQKWNNNHTTSYYKSPCNVIEGNTGELWPPTHDIADITVWMTDLCRPITYEFTREVIYNGILAYQYELGDKLLGNSTIRYCRHNQINCLEETTATTKDFIDVAHRTTNRNEDFDDRDKINITQCYCNGECSPMGLINITACRYGAPQFISLPHFYKGDPILRDQISGMNPNEHDHSSYITLDPKTGRPLKIVGRFQVNYLIQPSSVIKLFKHIPKMYFPILWFNITREIVEDSTRHSNLLWPIPKEILFGIEILMIVALILAIISIIQSINNKSGKSTITRTQKSNNSRTNSTNFLQNVHYWNDRLI